jgi:hypothetical protein
VLALFLGGAAADAADRADPSGVKHVSGGTLALPAVLAGGKVGGIATDAASGNVYLGVTRDEDSFVAVYDATGAFVRHWLIDNRPLTLRLDDFRLAVGPDGNVYVAPQLISSTQDELIKVYEPDGALVRTFGLGSHLFTVTDIEVDAAGNVFVTSRADVGAGVADDVIVKFNPQGQVVARFAPFPGERGQTGNDLSAVAVAPDGSLWVATRKLHKPIVHLDSAGKALTAPDFELVLPGVNDSVDDVDFAGGRLYASGYLGEQKAPIGLVVLSPDGRVQDSIAGRAHYVAVGPRVYLSAHELPGRRASHGGGTTAGYVPVPTVPGPGTDAWAICYPDFLSGTTSVGGASIRMRAGQAPDCSAGFTQKASPWPNDDCHPIATYVGGEPLPEAPEVGDGSIVVTLLPGEVRSGSVIVEWLCEPGGGQDPELRYESKGEIILFDPSGVVLAGKSSKLVAGASVRLQYSPNRGGRFGTPALSLMDPQLNPQVTQRDGAFGWDVAAGFWRLRVTAYGYKPFVSPVYLIPPEVTGLQLRLKSDPKQQARLIDPFSGKAGPARVGARKPAHAAGLKLKVVRGKVKRIDIRSGAYRTVFGMRRGSPLAALTHEYAAYVFPAQLKAGKALSRYKIGKATFRIKKGRVASIVLGG